ncbi:phage baseplate assembly protein domain-containing protein [Methylomonas rapida]|uniref:Phage baseplate assembly protein n=1 Tax=Methylomonas rapida TaxID=2963939 RepID=A0ABY7GFI6_9GAMM|nr:phage baseplate assembly protein [Methylomonas rapida]WAR43594.1 phage baseplate assembly protein [Methylomonas rapida]WAR45465.1 phage baseplate assembly protein [Methylomonas rapida]
MQQIWNRLQLLFAHGVATLIGQEKLQARILDGEVLNNLARVEPYGFSYRPKPGAQAYLLFPSGDRSYGVAIVIGDKRYQLELVEGEVALHDDIGHVVKLGRNGIAIDGGGHDVTIANAPNVLIPDGDVIVGNISVLHHLHKNVQPGSGNSGEPV